MAPESVSISLPGTVLTTQVAFAVHVVEANGQGIVRCSEAENPYSQPLTHRTFVHAYWLSSS
jgi:hypothetical protein